MRKRRRADAAFSLFAFQDIITAVTGIVVLITLVLILELIQSHERSPQVQTDQTLESLRSALTEATRELHDLQTRIADEAAITSAAAAATPGQIGNQLDETRQQVAILERRVTNAKVTHENRVAQREKWQQEIDRRSSDREKLEDLRLALEILKTKYRKLANSNRVIYNPSDKTTKTAWILDVNGSRILVAPVGSESIPLRFEASSERVRISNFLRWMKRKQTSEDYFVLVLRPNGLNVFRRLRREIEQRGFDIGFDVVAAEVLILDPESGAAF